MNRRVPVFGTLALLLGLQVSAGYASAQTYVGGSGFAEIKRFGSTRNVYYGTNNDFTLDGTGSGGGLRVGSFIHPRVTIELAVEAGTATTSDVRLPVVILAIYPPPNLNLKASTRFLAVSTLLGYHPPARGRVRLGYLVGFSFIRGVYKTDYNSYVVPLAIFSGPNFAVTASPTSVLSTIYPSPVFVSSTLTERQLTTGAILGFETAVRLTGGLEIVPEVRALAFSTPNNGPGAFLIFPGVGVRWVF